MDVPDLRRSMRLSVIEGALATSMGSLLTGVVITGFALALGASRLEIGLLAALPTLANFAQLVGAALLDRYGARKRLCLATLWLGRLVWLPLIGFALLAGDEDRGVLIAALLAVAGASHLLFAVGGVAWLSWIRDLIPGERRVGFLALRNQFDTFLSLGVGILASLFIDWQRADAPDSIGGFLVVLLVAVACGLAGMPLLASIPDPGLKRRAAHERKPLTAPLGDGNFRRLVAFYSCWNLAANLATPFFVVFMLQKLAMPLWQVTALLTLGSVAGLAANGFWSRLATRFGVKPVVLVATIGDALLPLALFLVEPAWAWALPFVYLLGAFNSPVAIGANNLLLRTAPDHGAPSYFALFNTIVGLVTALAAILGGALLHGMADLSLAVGPIELGALKIVFLLSFLGRLASLAILRRVAEPGAVPTTRMIAVVARAARLAYVRWQTAPAPLAAPAATLVPSTIVATLATDPAPDPHHRPAML